MLLWPLVLLASFTTPGVPDVFDSRHILLIAALTWPGLALLGAGLAPTAVGSRIDAVVAGVALGIGAPVAAIMSLLISVTIVAALFPKLGTVGQALGLTIQLGVLGAVRIAPLVAVAVVIWLAMLRAVRAKPAT